jgi:hypothetical protein
MTSKLAEIPFLLYLLWLLCKLSRFQNVENKLKTENKSLVKTFE